MIRTAFRLGILGLLSITIFGAVMALAGSGMSIQFDVARELQEPRAASISTTQVLRSIYVRADSADKLVLIAVVTKRGTVVAVRESQPFKVRGQTSLFGCWPKEWKFSDYLPVEFAADDSFVPGRNYLSIDNLPTAGESASSLTRTAGVRVVGQEMLVLFAVPADEAGRGEAHLKPVFIVGKSGFIR